MIEAWIMKDLLPKMSSLSTEWIMEHSEAITGATSRISQRSLI